MGSKSVRDFDETRKMHSDPLRARNCKGEISCDAARGLPGSGPTPAQLTHFISHYIYIPHCIIALVVSEQRADMPSLSHARARGQYKCADDMTY